MTIKEKKRALISGITGQDGSYLCELLIEKGYEVHGIKRRSSLLNTKRIDHLYDEPQARHRGLILHYGDLTDSAGIIKIVKEVEPDEIGLSSKTKFYQASSSELFGLVQEIPQTESTPFYPRSPYAVAKLYSYWITINYRESYGIFACNGILFNHESPRRGETFVTRKITRGLSRVALGLEECLYVGNINALRDWGHARDYVQMQWLMLQQDKPTDYVISSGKQHSVRQFILWTAAELGIELEFTGSGLDEVGIVVGISGDYACSLKVGNVVVRVDSRYFRPSEVDTLLGDSTLAQKELGWKSTISAKDMCEEMVRSDFQQALKEAGQ